MEISTFCQKHQRQFGTDATFSLVSSVDVQEETRGFGPQHQVCYEIKTNFGAFKGYGPGKKQARAAAVKKAVSSEACPF